MTTKKASYVFVSFLFGGVLFLFHRATSHSPLPKPPRTVAKLLASPVAIPVPLARETELACKSRWREIAAIDLNEYGAEERDEPGLFGLTRLDDLTARLSSLPRDARCEDLAGQSAELVKASAALASHCIEAHRLGQAVAERTLVDPTGEIRDLRGVTILSSCLSSLTVLRQEIADAATEGMPLEDIEDASLLTQKLLARGRKAPGDLATLRAISARLREIDPANSYVAEISLQIAYVDWWRGHAAGRSPQSESSVNEAFERMEALDPDGGYYLNYKLHHDVETGDYAAVERYARQLNQKSPSNLASYALARVAHREGRIEEAKEHLREIVSRQSHDDKKFEARIALARLDAAVLDSPERVFPTPFVTFNVAYLLPPAPSQNGGVYRAVAGDVGFELMPTQFADPQDPVVRTVSDTMYGSLEPPVAEFMD